MSITLNQLIDQVREELLEPRRVTKEEAMYPFLFVEEIEIEVGVKVASNIESSGKINIKVIEIGTGSELQDEETHRIKIKLTPLYSKDEIRKQIESQLGTRGIERVQNASVKGTAKNLIND